MTKRHKYRKRFFPPRIPDPRSPIPGFAPQPPIRRTCITTPSSSEAGTTACLPGVCSPRPRRSDARSSTPHVLGGATVREQYFPFTFSVSATSVSLLRPRSSAPRYGRHGLELLPLDGTFTPMPSGAIPVAGQRPLEEPGVNRAHSSSTPTPTTSTAWRWSRWTASPAESSGSPRRPDVAGSARPARVAVDGRASRRYATTTAFRPGAAADDERGRLPRPVIRPTSSSDDERLGIIGTFLGVQLTGTAYVLLHHYIEQINGTFRYVDLSRGGTGGVNTIAAAARPLGAEIRAEARSPNTAPAPGTPPASCSRTATNRRRRRRARASIPRLTSSVPRRRAARQFLAGVQAYKSASSSGEMNLALDGLPDLPRAGPGEHLRGAIQSRQRRLHRGTAYDEAKSRPFLERALHRYRRSRR